MGKNAAALWQKWDKIQSKSKTPSSLKIIIPFQIYLFVVVYLVFQIAT